MGLADGKSMITNSSVGSSIVGLAVGLLVVHVLIGPDGVENVVGKLTDTGQIFMLSVPASRMSPSASLEMVPSEA